MDHDALICVIMTHGDEDGLKGVDDRNESIDVEEITSLFQGDKCPQLVTKPKLFFIQACRGSKTDSGSVVPKGGPGDDIVPDSEVKEITRKRKRSPVVMKVPSEADFLIAFSTTKHCMSYRNFTDNVQLMAQQSATMGSWFISSMVQVFRAYSHQDDLMTMLTRVNKSLAELYTGENPSSGSKQMSCQLSMLTKKVYFVGCGRETFD